eukprot:SAG22_NODE_1461_length_4369_cov_4.685012_4_plen_62_part_00
MRILKVLHVLNYQNLMIEYDVVVDSQSSRVMRGPASTLSLSLTQYTSSRSRIARFDVHVGS